MIIYIVVVIMMYMFSIITKKMKNSKFYYCILTGIMLFLLISLKNPFLGKSDTLTIYYPAFKNIIAHDFKYVFFRYYEESMLFYIVTKLITIFTTNVNIYYAILEIPLIFGVTKLIYKYSKMPVLSYILFFSLHYYFFSYIALKHAVALGIILFAIDAAIEKKWKKFFIITALATLFHPTAIIFFIIYPVRKLNLKKSKIFILIFILLGVVLFKDKILDIIFSVLKDGRYSMYKSRSNTINIIPFLINIIMLTFSYIIKNNKQNQTEELILKDMLWLGTIFSATTIVMAESLRISMFFSVSSIILIPNKVYESKKNEIAFFYIVISVVALIYCFYSCLPNLNLIPYKFWWENI